MPSYIPEVLYEAANGRWVGRMRFATREEAEANLADIRTRRDDILETRITESPSGATHILKNGYIISRGMSHDLRSHPRRP